MPIFRRAYQTPSPTLISVYLCFSSILCSCCLGFTLCPTAVQCSFFSLFSLLLYSLASCRLLAPLMFMCVRLYWFDGLKSSNHPRSVQIHWIGGAFFPFFCIFPLLFRRRSLLRIYVVFLCVFFVLFNLAIVGTRRYRQTDLWSDFFSLENSHIFFEFKWYIHMLLKNISQKPI